MNRRPMPAWYDRLRGERIAKAATPTHPGVAAVIELLRGCQTTIVKADEAWQWYADTSTIIGSDTTRMVNTP